MTTTDLKPGDIVQHPEHGFGFIVLLKKDLGDEPASEAVVRSTNPRRNYGHDWDLTGWERVETVRPGHVQVRVDDLDLEGWGGEEPAEWPTSSRLAVRAANALAAQCAESAPPADEPEIVGDGCECWVTPEHMWTTHYGAVEPGSQVENNPRCPKHGERPTSATVTLFCPDCGEAENVTVVMLGKQSNGERWFDLREFHAHTCPPAQPDEPQEFGAKATVAQADGHIERWLNMHAPPQGRRGWLTWDARDTAGSTPGQSKWADWSEIIQRGTVTLGWDE